MSIWALLAAPLIMGNDARKIPPASKRILLNEHVINIDQDELGRAGMRVMGTTDTPTQVWARELSGGDIAVGMYNKATPNNASTTFKIDLTAIGFAGQVRGFDCWAKSDAGVHQYTYTSPPVAYHDTHLVRFTPLHSAAA